MLLAIIRTSYTLFKINGSKKLSKHNVLVSQIVTICHGQKASQASQVCSRHLRHSENGHKHS